MKKLFDVLHIKRVFLLLLALCMAIGLMPITAHAITACYLSYKIEEGAGNSWVITASGGVGDSDTYIYKRTGTGSFGERSPVVDDLVEFWFDIEPGYALKSLKAKKFDGFYNEDVYVSAADLFYIENITPGMGQKYYTRFYLEQATVIELLTRRCVMTVKFDSNGGSGTMASQAFEYDSKQTLSENTFSKAGYTFAGWNTAADGSGTAYDDSAEAVFYPESDKEMTLYAQWSECTTHTWENGACSKCDLECAHSGYSYSGSGSVITESCEDHCGHSATATIERDTSVSATYTGSAVEALRVTYSAGWKGGNLDISYSDNLNAGTARGAITKAGATAATTFDILPKTATDATTPTVGSITYGQPLSDAAFEDAAWEWADGNIIPTVNNGGYPACYTPADTSNYDWTAVAGWDASLEKVVRTVPVTVAPKELAITWGNTSFVYDGSGKFPEITVSGIVAGDDVQLVHSGFEVNANGEGETYTAAITAIDGVDAANYKLPGNASQEFTIAKADQDAPEGLGKTDETAPGMSDGTITGVTANMEYRKAGETEHTGVNSSILEDLAPGTYYLRYAGDANHNPSEDVAITIEGKTYWVVFDFNGGNCFGITENIEVPLNISGILTDNVPWPTKEGHTFLGYYTEDNVLIEDPENYTFTQTTHLIAHYAIKEYTVTVPAEQIGYKLETDVTKIEHGGEVYIPFALKEGYKKARDFAVKVNGKKIELTEYNNVVVQATEDLVITVEGVTLNSKQPNANPHTGDNSNMAQWLVLFLFSSSAIITLIGVDRKRRSAKRE